MLLLLWGTKPLAPPSPVKARKGVVSEIECVGSGDVIGERFFFLNVISRHAANRMGRKNLLVEARVSGRQAWRAFVLFREQRSV